MKVKRFNAGDLPTVMNMIKEEFGPEAIILAQREIAEEHGGGVEITAGTHTEELSAKQKMNRAATPFKAPDFSSLLNKKTILQAKSKASQDPRVAAYIKSAPPSPADFCPDSHEFLELKKEVSGLKNDLHSLKELILDLAHRQRLSEKWRDRPDLINIYRRLLNTGLASVHARSLVETAAESAAAWGGEVLGHLRKTISHRLRIIDLSKPPKFLAVIGPSGAGKTSVLVNLAAFYRQQGLKTAAITLDTLRLGAADQLAQYARILGMGIKVCQNHDEFNNARECFEHEDLVLIDTPSRLFQKPEGRRELDIYLKEAVADTLLVLPAMMKEEDLTGALLQSRNWPTAGLAIAKFDETSNLGGLAGFLIAEAPQLAFFSLGQKISEDFMVAEPGKFMDLWLGNSPDFK